MATIEFTINMNCTVHRDDDAGVFVSHCPTLDIYSQDETEADALEAIKEAITLHITTAFDFNRLDKILRRAGFSKFVPNTAEEGPSYEDGEFVKVKVQRPEEYKHVSVTVPLRLTKAPQLEYACNSAV
jgi:predicted RNase H-like HicB family nuclease